MTEREKIEATVGLFYKQAQEDAARHGWFMGRLAQIARDAQAERRVKPASKGAKKK